MPKSAQRLDLAMVGTRGVPARYGGFETAVEEVGARLTERGHRVRVYCRPLHDGEHPSQHLGMELIHLKSLRRRSLETISHTTQSVLHLARAHRPDAVVVFNSANAPLIPPLRAMRIPVATHVDGLEWMRAKWNGLGKRYYRVAEQMAVRWSDALIADAAGIADYYRAEFRAATTHISYGAPVVDRTSTRLDELGLVPDGFHLVVARFEPENHVDVIVAGYSRSSARLPLVVVGSAPYSELYTQRVREAADERVRFLGGIWDQDLLDQLYANAFTYVHGHSVGGTNPSLLRAIGAGAPCLAYDVTFNREVLDDAGRYFRDAQDVAHLLETAESAPVSNLALRARSSERAAMYDWDEVALQYEALLIGLVKDGPSTDRPSGRRVRREAE